MRLHFQRQLFSCDSSIVSQASRLLYRHLNVGRDMYQYHFIFHFVDFLSARTRTFNESLLQQWFTQQRWFFVCISCVVGVDGGVNSFFSSLKVDSMLFFVPAIISLPLVIKSASFLALLPIVLTSFETLSPSVFPKFIILNSLFVQI